MEVGFGETVNDGTGLRFATVTVCATLIARGLRIVSGGTRAVAGYMSLAQFSNEAGLERGAANRWNASASSGTEQVGTPGGGYGLTSSGAVEMSNVDLASEFTTMITAQRGFQANSRVISTADEMLQDLVNLKH